MLKEKSPCKINHIKKIHLSNPSDDFMIINHDSHYLWTTRTNVAIEECEDSTSLFIHIPLVSITKQEEGYTIFIQAPYFPYRISLSIRARSWNPLLYQHTNSGPTSRKTVPFQQIPREKNI